MSRKTKSKRATLSILLLAILLLVSTRVNAQNFSIRPLEVQADAPAEMVVNIEGATAMTALQFNLHLPDDLTVNTSAAAVGRAANGHTLDVRKLTNGDYLFILYSMDLTSFTDGELLRIPVKSASKEAAAERKLYNVRATTAEGVSHSGSEAAFSVTVTADSGEEMLRGDVNGDGLVDVFDIVQLANIIMNQGKE